MTTQTVKIETLKEQDVILDQEGLELLVKKLVKVGRSTFEITTNYVESGFYRCVDTVRRKRGTTLVQKVVFV